MPRRSIIYYWLFGDANYSTGSRTQVGKIRNLSWKFDVLKNWIERTKIKIKKLKRKKKGRKKEESCNEHRKFCLKLILSFLIEIKINLWEISRLEKNLQLCTQDYYFNNISGGNLAEQTERQYFKIFFSGFWSAAQETQNFPSGKIQII